MMFLKNCWYVAAWESELADREPIARRILGEPIVLFRTGEDMVAAMADRCPHRRAPLSMGRVEEGGIRCMYHGLRFDLAGQCIEVPGPTSPPNCTVRVYPVHRQDDWIWVWMGDPALADTALVPKAFRAVDPAYEMRAGQIDYAANYMLINDNLCDLSHLDFTHETTLGLATGPGWSASTPRIQMLDRGIRMERWFVGWPKSPRNPEPVDNWTTYDYLAPGVFLMENRSYPPGHAERSDFGAPEGEPFTYRVEQQAVTPLSATETRYFFATGMDARMPAQLLEPIFEVVNAAFAEDRAIIEGQQRIWDIMPDDDDPMAFIAHDKGPAMFRRVMDRLIRESATG
ncbi:MAG: aromatic ring-hydroxylating dioxygenase subunit alpha [Sphingomonadales bacterium]|nr:aromatic ring-hydroxylating dioxygenase subunit alpha [Sphingomonadales bacterium]